MVKKTAKVETVEFKPIEQMGGKAEPVKPFLAGFWEWLRSG
jgi:hypothetical protein